MLFLNWYPGVDDPFLSSSLKMTICSNRKTRRSLERDKTLASCSVTKKVSCCSSFPWLVSLPCRTITLVNASFGSAMRTKGLLTNTSLDWVMNCVNVPRSLAVDPSSSYHYTVWGPETWNLRLSVGARETGLSHCVDFLSYLSVTP